ncbi:hypothetical protein B0H16DRAFT_1744955 [Mycena metata]|uniref:Uncharacterized protein n=1 Tax=Mycena metata TaxID=1033252 RepID=A0AAD7H4E9_9AGAR|nr:hypothetical protein B0H16DRAFT_1744955 [Mycena metata]
MHNPRSILGRVLAARQPSDGYALHTPRPRDAFVCIHGGLATPSLLLFLPSHLALRLPRFNALAFTTPFTTYAPTLSRRDPFA